MAIEEEKKTFSQDLPISVIERFDAFTGRKGLVKWRATAAALELIGAIPADIRDLLMEGSAAEAGKRLAEILGQLEVGGLGGAKVDADRVVAGARPQADQPSASKKGRRAKGA